MSVIIIIIKVKSTRRIALECRLICVHYELTFFSGTKCLLTYWNGTHCGGATDTFISVDALSSQTETKPIQRHFFSMPSSHNKLFARIREHKNSLRTAKLNLITIRERSAKKKSFHAINRFADQFFAIPAAHGGSSFLQNSSVKRSKSRVEETHRTARTKRCGGVL